MLLYLNRSKGGENMIAHKILILDIEKNSSQVMKNLLRNYGYEVIERVISNSIIEVIVKEMPHVIFLNCFSKTDKEIEICRILKDDSRTMNIPLIAVLDSYTIGSRDKYISMGVDDYLQYPLHEKDIMLTVKNQAKISSLQNHVKMCQNAVKESIDTVRKQKHELENNLNLAAKIHEALIPQSLGNIPNCSFSWLFQPSGKVGGDIFDAFMLDEDHLGLYMIDVMGHGVASSMLAVTLSETLIVDIERDSPLKRKINTPPYYEIVSPLDVIHYLNKRFPFMKYQHYFTIFYMVLNIKTGVMKYVKAGHPSPLLVKTTGDIIELDGYGTPVGFELNEEYEEKTAYLDSGDHVVIYTDGLIEVEDENGDPLEYEGIIHVVKNELIKRNHYLTTAFQKLVRDQVNLKDDLTILEMRWVKFI